MILTPSFIPRFRFSADFTRIKKTNEIQAPTFQFILDNEDSLPGRIVRGPNLPGDQPGWAGPITLFDATLINIASTRVDAYDFHADYTVPLKDFGDLHFYALATWMPHYKNQLLPSTPSFEKVGFVEGPLKWRGNGGFVWEKGPWNVGWNAQFYDSYFVYAATDDPYTRDYITSLQGSKKIPSQMYHDIIVTYKLSSIAPKGVLSNSEVSFGVRNIFDKRPPIVATDAVTVAGYSTYGDPRLRRWTISLRKTF
jgi:outer membrane receptor protein involved in Fe transport